MRRYHQLLIGFPLAVLTGCATTQTNNVDASLVTEEIEAFAICDRTSLGQTIENKVRAEYGFKRFTENGYRPVIEQRLFGHLVRVVELSDIGNKVYASGEPQEFAYHFKHILPDILCEKDTCQAPLPNSESLLVYKPKSKKLKDTTVIECTKPLQPEVE